MSDESRKQFEYEAGKALCLPTSIIEMARKGDGYDHAYDSMNIMQPLNGWWHWWQKSRAALVVDMPPRINQIRLRQPLEVEDMWMHRLIYAAKSAGITVKGEGDE